MTQKTRKAKAGTHPFVLDTDLPPDANGHYVCRCGLIGEPNDARHPALPVVPEQAVHRQRIGERADD